MSVAYKSIGWSRQKIIYDAILITVVLLYVIGYQKIVLISDANASAIALRIHAFGSAAFMLLHIVLIIGPLCRLSPKFLPLLYNRRHLGIMTFLLACFHAYYVTIEYHKWGKLEPIFNIFVGNTNYTYLTQFPFQTLGASALLILFFMVLISHDFWVKNLSPRVWKSLHMLVYLAYTLIVLHVLLGPFQFETNPIFITGSISGASLVVLLHLITGVRELLRDSKKNDTRDEFIKVGSPSEIPESRAKIISTPHERVAVFKHQGKIYALSNVCTHQNGPLGEGKIVNGCVTCPWHGYQFNPEDGRAPDPFDDKVATYVVKLVDGDVYVNQNPNPPGTKALPIEV